MSSATIPPLGQIGENDHSAVATYLADLARESSDARETWATLADEGLQIFLYGTTTAYEDGSSEVYGNEIQNDVIAATDIQLKEPPQISLDPVETGEPPTSFWAGPQDAAILPPEMGGVGLDPRQVAAWSDPADPTGGTQPPMPLDPSQADAIRMATAIPGGPMKPEWLVDVNDELVTETYQSVFDVLWARSGIDQWLRDFLLQTNIAGWQFGLYQWDDDRKRHDIVDLSIRQAYCDPVARDITVADYAGVDLMISAASAKKRYPDLADKIDAEADKGQVKKPQGAAYLGSAEEINYERDMVVLRIFWLRNQPVPLAPEEAAGIGLDTTGLSPETLDWPSRLATRQITVLAETVVDDRESEFFDIPLLHNVDIPIPRQPWGIGEPFRLRKLQDARNRVLKAMVAHADYFRHPLVSMPASVADAIANKYGSAYIEPGMSIIWPDELYKEYGGNPNTVLTPPPTPPALIELQNVLRNELVEQSGHAEVLQGRASSQVKSGRAIELLQSAAASMIGFKSARTGFMLHHLARLMLHSIVWRMEIPDLLKIISRYPPHILAAIHERARNLEWDVSVTVMAGAGAVLARKRAEAAEDVQLGAISLETYREIAGRDHKQEEQRMTQQMVKQAALMPATEEQPPADAGSQ